MKRCKFLTLMLALLLLLQSSALAADKGKTVTVTLPTFAVTLNDTKIDSAHSEYPLIVCRDIIKVHGGNFEGRNQLEGGTEFWFTLPLKEERQYGGHKG